MPGGPQEILRVDSNPKKVWELLFLVCSLKCISIFTPLSFTPQLKSKLRRVLKHNLLTCRISFFISFQKKKKSILNLDSLFLN